MRMRLYMTMSTSSFHFYSIIFLRAEYFTFGTTNVRKNRYGSVYDVWGFNCATTPLLLGSSIWIKSTNNNNANKKSNLMCTHLQHACIVSRICWAHSETEPSENHIFFPPWQWNFRYAHRLLYVYFFYYYLFKEFFLALKLDCLFLRQQKHSHLQESAEIDERNLTAFFAIFHFPWWPVFSIVAAERA